MLPPVPSAPAVASAQVAPPAAARKTVSTASYQFFILFPSLGCVSSPPCQTQVLQKNVISPTALPKVHGSLKKQREEGNKKNERHVLGYFLCLLGFPLAPIALP